MYNLIVRRSAPYTGLTQGLVNIALRMSQRFQEVCLTGGSYYLINYKISNLLGRPLIDTSNLQGSSLNMEFLLTEKFQLRSLRFLKTSPCGGVNIVVKCIFGEAHISINSPCGEINRT